MMKCRWWDSNPHGFPNDFESFASAIPPHRLIFNFGTLVPVSEDWRDVQEGCKKSCFDKPSKFNGHSWISRTDTENHEADFESPSSASLRRWWFIAVESSYFWGRGGFFRHDRGGFLLFLSVLYHGFLIPSTGFLLKWTFRFWGQYRQTWAVLSFFDA